MTDQEKLSEKLAIWAGLRQNKLGVYGIRDTNGSFHKPDKMFTDSLDACFKWLMPEFIKAFHNNPLAIELLLIDWREDIKHASQFADVSFYAKRFCLAIEKLIDAENKND